MRHSLVISKKILFSHKIESMRRFIAFLIFILSIVSCEKDPRIQEQNKIEELEQAVKEGGNQEDIEALLGTYQTYITEFYSDPQVPNYLLRAAELLARINRPQSAVELIEKGYREYYQSLNTASNGQFLGNIIREKLQNELLAQIVYKSTQELFPDVVDLKRRIIDSITTVPQILDNIGQSLFDENSGKIDFLQANNFIEGSVLFAMLQPQNQLVTDFLYKASETSRAIQKYERALDIYEWLIKKYPDYSKIGQIHFLYAFTLDNDLGNIEEARVAYNDFINKFPNSDFIDDAKFLIENLGKTEEEIIESFTKN